jgi:hypothetical protein
MRLCLKMTDSVLQQHIVEHQQTLRSHPSQHYQPCCLSVIHRQLSCCCAVQADAVSWQDVAFAADALREVSLPTLCVLQLFEMSGVRCGVAA